MRQVVLDTETTGLETERGHRIVEIGAVELVDRRLSGRRFHKYVNPQRDIDEGAQEVHGTFGLCKRSDPEPQLLPRIVVSAVSSWTTTNS